LTVRNRILAVSSALLVAVLVAVLVGIQVSDKIATDAEAFAERDVPAYQLLLSIDRDGYEAQLALRDLVATGTADADVADAAYAAFIENRDQTASRFEEYKEASQGHEGEEDLWPAFEEMQAA
jgi:hypothetical protein